ncbi:MAG: DUF3006 domain-containing protein [Ruminococcus sp.]|nr:DUF3006 domain-containing protein [Ruminococcus sp.]
MTILDRFEGNIAVIEKDGQSIEVRRGFVAENACEGDILTDIGGRYTVDRAATEERRRAMREKILSLIKKHD